MKIGICSTNEVPMQLPPGVVYAPVATRLLIADELARRGHDVTLYCSEDSVVQPPLKKVSCGIPSIYNQRKNNPEKHLGATYISTSDHVIYSEMYGRAAAGEHEVLLASNPFRVMPYLSQSHVPTLITLHDQLGDNHKLLRNFQKHQNHWYISISNQQRAPIPDLRYLSTIYHGISVDTLPFSETADDYFIYFGRMVADKGVLDAIEVAKRAGVKLKLAGPHFTSPEAAAYWNEIEQQIDGEQIEYLGSLGKEELFPIVSRAKAFINLINYQEAFGMVLIESMGCGTPVIARRRGSIPEVLDHNGTGFVVETIDEAVEAVRNINRISRSYCRTYVTERFNISSYVDQYEEALSRTVALHKG
jgi:glycosyltransferase involved in cell wall biosynthesis